MNEQRAITPVFSLLANPFALLGATPCGPVADLPGLADVVGTAAAAAAMRTLSVPKTRLAAELGFLPGAADAAPGILAALLRHERPVTALLPDAALANVLAHLCAAGRARPEDEAALVKLQPAVSDAALTAAIDLDRRQAGMPAVVPAMLAAEQEALADRHAGALVQSCQARKDAAGRLSELVRTAPDGSPSLFMRRATAIWWRQTGAVLSLLEEAATHAQAEALRARSAAASEKFAAAIRSWAGVSLPQRLSDARAGLDHRATLRLMQTWRDAGLRLAHDGHPELALPVARALAECFADLPGECARLANDLADCTSLVEDRSLEQLLAPLRALVERLGAAPAALQAELVSAPFGPGAPGSAGQLWAAFDSAAAACVSSEAPWTILRELAGRFSGATKMSGAAPARMLLLGLASRAEAAGFGPLAARLGAQARGLERPAAQWRAIELRDAARKGWSPLAFRRALKALRAAIALTKDPAERKALQADERNLANLMVRNVVAAGAVAFLLIMGGKERFLDQRNPGQAPADQNATLTLAPAPAPAPASAPVLLSAPPAPAPFPTDGLAQPEPQTATQSLRPMRPIPGMPQTEATQRDVPPVATGLLETAPTDPPIARILPEIRWCMFNGLRLGAARQAAGSAQFAALARLQATYDGLCGRGDYQTDEAGASRARQEARRDQARLEREGRLLLTLPAAEATARIMRPGQATPAPAPVRAITFLAQTRLSERAPGDSDHAFALPEVRWCMFNGIRLEAAMEAADAVHDTAQADAIMALVEKWRPPCKAYDASDRNHAQGERETRRDRALLQREGRDMLKGSAN